MTSKASKVRGLMRVFVFTCLGFIFQVRASVIFTLVGLLGTREEFPEIQTKLVHRLKSSNLIFYLFYECCESYCHGIGEERFISVSQGVLEKVRNMIFMQKKILLIIQKS